MSLDREGDNVHVLFIMNIFTPQLSLAIWRTVSLHEESSIIKRNFSKKTGNKYSYVETSLKPCLLGKTPVISYLMRHMPFITIFFLLTFYQTPVFCQFLGPRSNQKPYVRAVIVIIAWFSTLANTFEVWSSQMYRNFNNFLALATHRAYFWTVKPGQPGGDFKADSNIIS